MIEFDRHNAEVRAVWDAYCRGKPIRVPMILGMNPRFTMFGHEANPRRVTFEAFFTDPEVMLTRQLEHQSWVRRYVPQDAPTGPPEVGWDVQVMFLNSCEAGWFGCELRYFEEEAPDTLPLFRSDAKKREVLERGIPDPFSGGLMRRNWEFYEFFRQKQAEGFTWEGRPIARVRPAGLGSDGPMTVACNLRGAAEFCTDLAADPEYATALLDLITEATIARVSAYRKRLGLPLKTQGYAFADDAIQSISVSMYREMVMPFHRRLVGALSEGGPNAVHLCGDASRFFRLLRDEMDVQSFDTGFPIDFGWVRKQVGTGVEVKGGPPVTVLQHGSPPEVRAEVRRVLGSGIMDGGRFVLREANNLPPGVPLENLWAMYATVREFGRY